MRHHPPKTDGPKEPLTVAAPYGQSPIDVRLPAGTVSLVPREPEQRVTPQRFRRDLAEFLAHSPIDLSRPIMVVTDKTRRCDYPTYLPIALQCIAELRDDDQTFPIIIAYGTHPRQSDAESLACYGPTYHHRPFIHHDCDDGDCFAELGITVRGTPIRLRHDLLAASAVITMGPICHHYFAGYGGGRKLIFPGCGERRAIYANHGLFLDRQQGRLAAGCRPGNLADNPIADDLGEIEAKLPAQVAIHGLQDSRGGIGDMLIGRGTEHYLHACRRHAQAYEISGPQFDTIVASCGGFPKDLNFIQAHKAIHNSAAFVRDGGLLVVFAQCRDGIGSQTFLPWFRDKDFADAFNRLAEHYEGNGGTALAMQAKTRRIRIALVSELDSDTCALIGVEKWTPDTVWKNLARHTGTVGWIANASLLVYRQST